MGLLQNTVVTVVTETTEGTLQADAAGDALKLLKDAKPPDVTKKFIESPTMSGSLSPDDPLVGPDDGSFELPVALKGSGYSTTPPECDALLYAMFGKRTIPTGGVVAASPTPTTTAFTVTGSTFTANDAILVEIGTGWQYTWITAVTDGTGDQALTVAPALTQAPATGADVKPGVTYKLSSAEADFKSLSVYYYMDGIKFAMAGCRGNPSFEFKWGEVPTVKFKMELMSWTATDADIAFTPTYDTAPLFICTGGSFLFNGSEHYIESFALDLGLKIAKLGAIQAEGYHDIFVARRAPEGSFDPYATDVAHLTAFKAMTPGAINLRVGDSSNMIVMKLPRVMRKEVKMSDKEGVNTYDVSFAASKTVADDEVFLAFLSSVDPT